MKSTPPDFEGRAIEFRLDDGEICIYATTTGLEKLITYCRKLIHNPNIGHIHLEDYEALTKDSLKCTIAVFQESK